MAVPARPRYGAMSEEAGVAEVCWPRSKAHCCFAESIIRRLLIQAFVWAVCRARTKLGIAIAANKPMMATTIIISTRVKPDLLDVLIFILALCFLFAA